MSSSTPSWRGLDLPVLDAAVCKTDDDPDRWFEGSDGTPNPAKVAVLRAVCRACPARDACLDYALRADMHGVWAGFTQAERRPLLKPTRVCVVCGVDFPRRGSVTLCSDACRRGMARRKYSRYAATALPDRCGAGHQLTPVNTDMTIGGHRRCRTCREAS